MNIELTKKPKTPIIIEGFPGFGLVGTITTEFLIKHLNAKPIGKFWSDELLPIAAIHESRIVEPLGIFYAKKQNLVIIHALSAVRGLEWQLAEILLELCKELKAKELISLEGIGSKESKLNTYYYTNNEQNKKRLEGFGLKPLQEGMVMGVTGALLLKDEKILSCIFVESSIGIADSKAAAKMIEILDKYLGLNVDYKPLLKAAEKFEETFKALMQKNQEAAGVKKSRDLNYMG